MRGRLTALAMVGLLAPTISFAATEVHELRIEAGERLEIGGFAGQVTVGTWPESRVEVRATHREGEVVRLWREGSVVRLSSDSWARVAESFVVESPERGVLRMTGNDVPGLVDYEVRVPEGVEIEVVGPQLDVTISGLKAAVHIEAFSSRVRLSELADRVRVTLLDGEVTLEAVAGDAEVISGSGDVRVRGGSGAIAVETIDGDVDLDSCSSRDVRAETLSGEVRWSGRLAPDGSYDLATHSGALTVSLPRDADATVSVHSHRGSVTDSFGSKGAQPRRTTIALGSGSAKLRLESFSGPVDLRALDE